MARKRDYSEVDSLLRLAHQISVRIDESVRDLKITSSALDVLYQIEALPSTGRAATRAALAKTLNLTRPTMTTAIARLLKNSLIEECADPYGDARRKSLRLSSKGVRELRKAEGRRARTLELFIGDLVSNDWAKFAAMVEKVQRSLRENDSVE